MPIALVTWNLFNHPPTFAKRLPAILQTLADHPCDLLVLQEVPVEGAIEYALGRELGFETVASVPFLRPDDGWAERLAVLSRFRVSEFEPLELRPGVPNALRVRIESPEGRFDVYNLHLHPRDQELHVRETLLVAAQRGARAAVASVIAGDFNARPDNPLFGHLAGFRPGYDLVHGGPPDRTFATPLRTDLEPRPAATLDHVLVEPELIRVKDARRVGDAVGEQWPSDHWGLWIEFEFAPA